MAKAKGSEMIFHPADGTLRRPLKELKMLLKIIGKRMLRWGFEPQSRE
ncbi:MAG TPA: hypothetical protein PLM24_00220 [Methanothrix sp.]|nr:hypothetical protein [Methanothrix sp.]HPR65541.1 hypothetical protein [Methanothrix sp.]